MLSDAHQFAGDLGRFIAADEPDLETVVQACQQAAQLLHIYHRIQDGDADLKWQHSFIAGVTTLGVQVEMLGGRDRLFHSYLCKSLDLYSIFADRLLDRMIAAGSA